MKKALCAFAFATLGVGVPGEGHEAVPPPMRPPAAQIAVLSGDSTQPVNPSDDPATTQARGDGS